MHTHDLDIATGFEARAAHPVTPATLRRVLLCAGFLAAAVAYAVLAAPQAGMAPLWMAIAAAFGGYMALNIGANDVANNIGPLVGARIMPLGAALVMAAGMEAAGAILGGDAVVGTIRKGIIMPTAFADTASYVWAMMAALLAAALWLNMATSLGAPVSTTHSIVGGVLGAGVAAAGFGIVDWPVMGRIAASWLISPLLGALLAAFWLALIGRMILARADILRAAGRGVPLLAAAMCWAFAGYLMTKVMDLDAGSALMAGLPPAGLVWLAMRAHVARRIVQLDNNAQSVNRLLGVPLILAAGALSFAHGSNDVANAIGPLAGIVEALASGEAAGKAAIPAWVMVLGGVGLAIGLLLFGPRVIRTIGTELTRLDATGAYSIAMAATLTVILASQLGLPVSTTHVTVGAVLGVGFLREAMAVRAGGRGRVNRRLMLRIFAAWIITVPATAALAGLTFFTLRGALLP
ncbi:MAG: inorganic phosphate transporter [Tropicimonas sp.]|uniref:inorganic phosphate transporter n=1 Tax=Tropicimonas sp. TaxID=2067044 RepID=UPI003A856B6F